MAPAPEVSRRLPMLPKITRCSPTALLACTERSLISFFDGSQRIPCGRGCRLCPDRSIRQQRNGLGRNAVTLKVSFSETLGRFDEFAIVVFSIINAGCPWSEMEHSHPNCDWPKLKSPCGKKLLELCPLHETKFCGGTTMSVTFSRSLHLPGVGEVKDHGVDFR